MAKDNRHRQYLYQTYNHLYSKLFSEEGCYYCGDYHEVWDHCPPLSWVEAKKHAQWNKDGIPFVLIPSCADCNSMLGDKPYFTVPERLDFLERKLTNKIEKGLSLWSEEEIAEMSPLFQRRIRAGKEKIQLMASRLHGVQQRIFDTDTHPEI